MKLVAQAHNLTNKSVVLVPSVFEWLLTHEPYMVVGMIANRVGTYFVYTVLTRIHAPTMF